MPSRTSRFTPHASRPATRHLPPSTFHLPPALSSILRLSSFVLLLLSACSLAEDITPPPGIQATETAAVQSGAAPISPEVMPDAAAGAAIFAQHCVQCHGPAGKGDGPRAAQVQGQLPDFSLADFRRTPAPQEWFQVITTGRLEKTMPPFADALTDAERWDVTAFLYTLSISTATLEQGQQLYTAQCAACHGATGLGNGPQGSADVSDFTSPKFFATKSEQEFYLSLTDGLPTGSHSFTGILNEAERWAVVDYVHSLGYQSQSTVPANGLVTVQGRVTNGTAGASVPVTLPVVLHVFEDITETKTYTTTLSHGVYTFADLPLQPQQSLAVTTNYADVRYLSQIIQIKGTEQQVNLPLQIFETTTDPGAIRIETWHIFFQAEQSGTVQVGEVINFSNTGDRTFTAPKPGEATVEIPLPSGATGLQFDDGALGEHYLATAQGFAHTASVRPGAQSLSVFFYFDLPSAGQLDFTQTTHYPVEAVNVLAPNGRLEVKSGQLAGPQTQKVEGATYLIYTDSTIPAGGNLALTLTPANPNANLPRLALGGFALIAVVVLGVGWFKLRKTNAMVLASTARREELIRAIAQLDERLLTGTLSDADHRAQRAKLKAEALRLMEQGVKRDS
jgi:mono/diheme cytochrome c family protein